MSRLHLEILKFSVYVFIPIGAVVYFQDPKVFRRIIEQRNYIRYPPEDERRPEDLMTEEEGFGGISNSPHYNDYNTTSTSSTSTTKSTSTTTTPLLPRRYGLFGPRDDPIALAEKRKNK